VERERETSLSLSLSLPLCVRACVRACVSHWKREKGLGPGMISREAKQDLARSGWATHAAKGTRVIDLFESDLP